VSGRPVLNFSFALNYAISGEHPWSYHVVNLGIHLAAALTLFGILRRTWWSALSQRASCATDSSWPAAAAAILWAVHPLTTESVTYLAQRAESLMALFYLLTLYCAARATTADRPKTWESLSVLCCLLGVGTKEAIVSAPIAVVLYDRAFAAPTWRALWRGRRSYYLALFATWIPLLWLVATGGWDRGVLAFAG